MPLVINDASWWKSKDYRDFSRNKKFSKEMKYGSIIKQIYYTVIKEENLDGGLDTYEQCEFNELVKLEKTFDRKWNYITLRYLIWKYPQYQFWTPLKNRPSYLGSTQGDICRMSDKRLLAKFMIDDGYVGVELCNEEVHCVSNLILEMAMPDAMKPISRPIHTKLPNEVPDEIPDEISDKIPVEIPSEEARKFAAEFPECENMLHNGLLDRLLNRK